jgi:hypothetical protein
VHPHRFRHTNAHDFLLAGGQERDLMRLLGWRSESMLSRYGAQCCRPPRDASGPTAEQRGPNLAAQHHDCRRATVTFGCPSTPPTSLFIRPHERFCTRQLAPLVGDCRRISSTGEGGPLP